MLDRATTHLQPSVSIGRVLVVLPAYNEEQGLELLLGRMKRTFELINRDYEIIVVNDASKDRTEEVATEASEHMNVLVRNHEVNQGLSGAIETGLRTAVNLAEEQDVIISMDADDTHNPGSMQQMLMMIEEGHDIVIASRYQAGAKTLGVPLKRRFLPIFGRMLFRTLCPIPGVRDYTCGFRAYKVKPLRDAMEAYGQDFFSEKGFSCMVDILLKMRKFNPICGEVPMVLRYDQKHGASKMDVGSTIVTTLKLLLKRRFGK